MFVINITLSKISYSSIIPTKKLDYCRKLRGNTKGTFEFSKPYQYVSHKPLIYRDEANRIGYTLN